MNTTQIRDLIVASTFLFGLLLIFASLLQAEEAVKIDNPPAGEVLEIDEGWTEYFEKLKEQHSEYWKYVDKTEKTPSQAYEWLQQDLKNMSTWEYRVLTITKTSDAEIEKQLNELGNERWECVAITRTKGRQRFILKRPKKSYMRSLPLKELLKLFGMGGGTRSE